MKVFNIKGDRFGRLSFIENRGRDKWSHRIVLWKCDCGNEKEILYKEVSGGRTSSCGCYRKEVTSSRSKKHGFAGNSNVSKRPSAEYSTWVGIKDRCHNENCYAYKYYGKMGIIVCDRWINSFENFLSDMGKKPSKKHSIDRYPDTNGNYEPSNCRWATTPQQARNKNNNVWHEHNGIRLVITDWAKMLNVDCSQLRRKIEKIGFAEAYNYIFYGKTRNRWLEHNGERMILRDWAKRIGVDSSVIRQHIIKRTEQGMFEFYHKKGVI